MPWNVHVNVTQEDLTCSNTSRYFHVPPHVSVQNSGKEFLECCNCLNSFILYKYLHPKRRWGVGWRAANVTNLLFTPTKLIKISLPFPFGQKKGRGILTTRESAGERQAWGYCSHTNNNRSSFLLHSWRHLETAGFFSSHHQDCGFFQKDPSVPLAQKVPALRPPAVLQQRILGMGKGMVFSLERLVWNWG